MISEPQCIFKLKYFKIFDGRALTLFFFILVRSRVYDAGSEEKLFEDSDQRGISVRRRSQAERIPPTSGRFPSRDPGARIKLEGLLRLFLI